MATFHNRVRFKTPTTGTGVTLTVGAAFSTAFLTPAEAGAVAGETPHYLVVDGADMEIGAGTVGASATTFERTTVTVSKIGGTVGTARISLTANSEIAFIESAAQLEAVLAHIANTANPHAVTKAQVGLGNADNTSDANKPISTATQTALDAKVAKAGDTMTGFLTLHADPDAAMKAATKQYVDQIIAAQDAMVFKGVIDCSTNPNYPAADRGHTYRVSVAGKIGGASGVNVEASDLLLCLTDGTPSGDQATVGADWSISQANIDGAVIGPASAVSGRIASFNGTTGKLIQDAGVLAADVVTGPASAVTARIATFNGTSGKVIQDSGQTVAGLAPLASPAFTGNPTAPTPTAGDNDTSIATTAFVQTALGLLPAFRNLLINPAGQVNQRLPASNADDTYGHDRWYALTQTGAIAVSTLSDVEDGTPKMWRLTQSQASAQRMGYAQIIEGVNCKHLRGKSITLSGRVRCSAAATLRYAILTWTGTEDAPPSDVVLTWTSTNYTAGNFFINTAGFSVLAVGSTALSANTLTDLTALGATLGSSANNVYVFLWTEGTVAQNVTLDAALQLEVGNIANPREIRPFGIELDMCQRYYRKSYDLGVAPATATNIGAIAMNVGTATTQPLSFSVTYPVQMRVTATVTMYDFAGASGKVYKGANGKNASLVLNGMTGFNGGTVDATSSNEVGFQYTADAEI